MIDLPSALVARTEAGVFGEEGKAWLATLPSTIERLREDWDLALDKPFDPGGYVSWAAPGMRSGREQVVLKVGVPDRESRHEADALRHFDGRGAVRLLEVDPASKALLLERASPGVAVVGLDDETATSACAGVLRQLWRAPAEDHPFDLVRDRVEPWIAGWHDEWERSGRPCPRRFLDEAASVMRERVADAAGGGDVVLHGDLHQENVLTATREPFLAIDPKPMVGPRELDLFALLADRGSTLVSARRPNVVKRRADQLADELGLDRTAICAWAFACNVELSLWAAGVGEREAATGGFEFAEVLEEEAGLRRS